MDATPPVVKKITPATWKPTTTFKVTFSEKVKGISGKSIMLQKQVGKKYKKVPAKIKSLKKGKIASIDPKGRLRPGSYRILFNAKKIKDVHGNNLAANEVAQELRFVGTVRGGGTVAVQQRRVPGSGTTP